MKQLITNYKHALDFINNTIPRQADYRFPGELGLERTKYFLKCLGNPDMKLKIIHVAGTSGKGSTCYYISKLLNNHGFRVGLTLSPHLLDIRERIQINNQMISRKGLIELLNDVLPAYQRVEKSKFGAPTYFELLIAMMLLHSYQQNVDFVVLETGLGGLFDGTNAVDATDKTCVITRIGFDHVRILGNTLSKIAAQKAGIIHKGNTVITTKQESEINSVMDKTCSKLNANLIMINYNRQSSFSENIQSINNFVDSSNNIALKSLVELTDSLPFYQQENFTLALTTLFELSEKYNFQIKNDSIIKVLKSKSFRGRFEIIKKQKKMIILDGAHNPQKMEALTKSLKLAYPATRFDVLFAVKDKKNLTEIMRPIVPITHQYILTKFVSSQESGKRSYAPRDVKNEAIKLGINPANINVELNLEKALMMAISSKSENPLLITGSLYLISQIYPLLAQ